MIFNNSWDLYLKDEINKKYFQDMLAELTELYHKEIIFPKKEDLFRVFNLEIKDIKIVILGQDPYHGEGEADGFAFSTRSIKRPPSLRNIFKELYDDMGVIKNNNDLSSWHKEGVFLLNSILAVIKDKPLSLKYLDFEKFTDAVIKTISENSNNVVFILWGNYAICKRSLINEDKHFVITSSHPSPFSASKSFLGSRCFSKANNYLKNHHKKEVDFN